MNNKNIRFQILIAVTICLLSSCGAENRDSQDDHFSSVTPTENGNASTCENNKSLATGTIGFLGSKKKHLQHLVANRIQHHIQQTNMPFDWNTVDNDFFCESLLAGDGVVTIGAKMGDDSPSAVKNLTSLEGQVRSILPPPLVFNVINTKLNFLTITLNNCDQVATLRELATVDFMELSFGFSNITSLTNTKNRSASSLVCESGDYSARTNVNGIDDNGKNVKPNPGLYDPDTNELSYVAYIDRVNKTVANRMRRHNMDKVYDTYRYFGSDQVGVAVLDNGVLARKVDYLSAGSSAFSFDGYFTTPYDFKSGFDGSHPKFYDAFGLAFVTDKFGHYHGTEQSENIYSMAPNATRLTIRAADFMVLYSTNQIQGVTNSIMAVADNPSIRIVSMSMGTPFHIHSIERAIDYLVAKDKIFVAAAGTSIPEIKGLLGIVFPARLPSTISVTGIRDTRDTNGEFILGDDAHGGLQNDFVIDDANASSPSASTFAGMLAVVWSINPSLSRDEVFAILKESSTFYSNGGVKDTSFGWGKVDMLTATEKIISTLPAP